MEKITFCIPSKSNLRYLKTCIPSIRNYAFRKAQDNTTIFSRCVVHHIMLTKLE